MTKEVKDHVPWTYIINDEENGEEITEKFFEKELQKNESTNI